MKKFFKIFVVFVRNALVHELQYRGNFFVDIIISLGWTGLSFLIIDTIGSNVSIIKDNWSREEYLLIWSIYGVSTRFTSIFFKKNIQEIPHKILQGDLDFPITRPVKSQLIVSVGYVQFGGISGLLFSLLILIRSIFIIWDDDFLVYIMLLFPILLGAIIIDYSLMFIVNSLAFWLVGAYNLIYLYHTLQVFGSYPTKAFTTGIQLFLTVLIPLSFIGSFPAEILINFSIIKIGILILVTGIVLWASNALWNIGLKGYSSASS